MLGAHPISGLQTWKILTIYDKFFTHLHWFGSRFTLKSAQARKSANDFHAAIRAPFAVME
jgi:hypothetical protein